MRCFFNNEACHGPVERAGGHTDSLWLNGSVDHSTGYCEWHRNKALFSAMWEMGKIREWVAEGRKVRSYANSD